MDAAAAAAQYANKVATIDRGHRWNVASGQRWLTVNGLSSGLLGLDLEIGDRVGALMLNSGGILSCGLPFQELVQVMNDLNYRLAEERTAFICGDSDVKVLFVDDNYLTTPITPSTCRLIAHAGVDRPGDAAPEGCIARDACCVTSRRSSSHNTTASPQSFTPEVQQGFCNGDAHPSQPHRKCNVRVG